MKILFLIRSLGFGGAERQLVNVAKGLHKRGHDILVVTFYSGGQLEKELSKAHVLMHSLEKRGRWDLIRPTIHLIRLVRKIKPTVIYGYLPSENILAVATKAFCPFLKAVWGLRTSDIDLSRYDWFTRFTYQAQKYLAPFADLIVVNSHAGHDHYIAQGFPERKVKVIHNGIDTERFKPNEQAGRKVRSEWNVHPEEKLVGLVGRLDPVKDHQTFLKAAALLAQEQKDVRFVCIGDGPAEYRDELHMLSVELGVAARMIWAGAREEIESIYNAFDVLVSSSSSEGFSNVLCEGIACGIPCVASDVGDSAHILGDSAGIVVPRSDARALADAILSVMRGDRRYRPVFLHKMATQSFGLERVVRATEEQLTRLLCHSCK